MRIRCLAACLSVAVLTSTFVISSGAAEAAPRPTNNQAASKKTRVITPALVQRATLSADYLAPGPPSGAEVAPANGRTGPFRGQVIPGFSGMIDNGNGTFWAQPDNGFGTRANSADFLLRLYLVRPTWETASGGRGKIDVLSYISLRDPDHKVTFPIVNENKPGRLLTGGDFDIESVVREADGSFWIGDEFGPFLIHISSTGRVLSAPVAFPGGKSPDNPFLVAGETPQVQSSRGFEALAGSRDGRYLYPILEGALVNDTDSRRRVIYQFDIARNRYTNRTWAYQTDQASNVVGDAYLVVNNRLLVVERDNFEGPAAATKRVYAVNLAKSAAAGFAIKALVVDLLKIANPGRIGLESSAGAYGVAKEFSFPFQSVETVVPLRNGDLLIANDNNYPSNAARYPGTPDDTEMIVLKARAVSVYDPEQTLIAHRGASGYRPEHTLASYELAIRMCADFIEPDVVSTKDGVLVARHENEIGGTTNVSALPEFASRETTKTIDGRAVTGWFTEDFTLAELKTLRAKERLPDIREQNTVFDGLYEVPTLDEVVDLARHSRTCSGHRVGVYPETKHPTYFRSIGLPLEDRLLRVLTADGYGSAKAPVFIQSFETGNLKALNARTGIRLIQLVDCSGAPSDLIAAGDERTYADLATKEGLRAISGYADGVGVCKDVLIPRDTEGRLLQPTPVIADAHSFGLGVVGWTFRRENRYLPLQFKIGTDDNAPGNLIGEIRTFLAAGMDGFFTDNPNVGSRALS